MENNDARVLKSKPDFLLKSISCNRLGEIIKFYRKKTGLTQSQVAKKKLYFFISI